MRDVSHIPDNKVSRIKMKLRNTCEKYCNVMVPYKQRDTISKRSKREDIVVLKQYKRRWVVIMDTHKYTNKCLAFLSTKQFTTLAKDSAQTLESRVKQTLQKIKSKFAKQEYKVYTQIT